MRIQYFAIALLPFSLAACQSNDVQTVRDQAVQIFKQQSPSKVLTAYTWQLDTGTNKPMQLNFQDDHRLSVQTTCNSLTMSWQVESNEIITSQGMMTQMACSETAGRQEGIALRILNERKIPFVLNLQNAQNPTLTLMDASGKRYEFKGKMTPETKYNSQGETIFLEISPQMKACTGIVPQSCLQVREIKYNNQGIKTHVDANWSLFYDQIQGFEHSPNERQVIRVKRYEIRNPAADQSKYAYVHDMTVERESIKGSL
jgi:heat shock protein HslJ